MGIEITVSGEHGLDAVIVSLQRAKGSVGADGAKVVRRNAKRLEGIAKRNAPVDTGALQQSISTETSGDGRFGGLEADIGSSLVYAGFVERGTSKMAPRAYLGPAFDRVAPDFIAESEALAGDVDL